MILYKCLQSWKETHGGIAPKNYREKQEFKELIRSGIRKNEESGVPEDEENFEEALQAVNTSLNPTRFVVVLAEQLFRTIISVLEPGGPQRLGPDFIEDLITEN